MGNCCSADDQQGELEIRADMRPVVATVSPQKEVMKSGANRLAAAQLPKVSEASIADFRSRISSPDGVPLIVLLSNGLGVPCHLQLEKAQVVLRRSATISRALPLSSIATVLFTPFDMKRIKTDAVLNNQCAALMLDDGTCIVLYFDSNVEKDVFVATAAATFF